MKVKKSSNKQKNQNPSKPAMQPKKSQRSLDLEQKRSIPSKKLTGNDSNLPPLIVIFGSKGSGKSTLLRSLIKRFTKQTPKNISGPVTVITDKSHRVTLLECKPDLTSMIDASKIADLVIFTIDITVGIQTEVLEFAALLKAHGMPKSFLVITNTDNILKNEKRKEPIKKIKETFIRNIGPVTKPVLLKGLEKTTYKENDLLILARNIIASKPFNLTWKNTHGHICADKLDNESNEISFYGYLRGCPLRESDSVCIPGIGDFTIKTLSKIQDPCPLPIKDKKMIRAIQDKSKLMYSPFSGIEGIFYDDESVYVDIKKQNKTKTSSINTIDKPNAKEFMLTNEISVRIEESKEEKIEPPVEPKNTIKNESGSEEDSDIDFKDDDVLKRIRSRFVFGDEEVQENREEILEGKRKRLEQRYDELVDSDNENIEETEIYDDKQERIHCPVYPGDYIKLTLNSMPLDIIEKLDTESPVLIGKIDSMKTGLLVAKTIRSRQNKKILKTREPLLFSIGWGRFQSVPIFSIRDPTRNKYLKYTPENMHCLATFYSREVPQGTGLCAIKNISPGNGFRISLTGSIIEQSKSSTIHKKLKLIGEPEKINKKTAFITKMFNSHLEVCKFEGGLIKTVSGIRGRINKAVHKEGSFRATFEDEIQQDDVIILRTWQPVDIPLFYNPMTEKLGSWARMRTNKELREAHGITLEFESNRVPDDAVRIDRSTISDKVPNKVRSRLPFELIDKSRETNTETYLRERIPVPGIDEEKKIKAIEKMRLLKKEADQEKQIIVNREKKKVDLENAKKKAVKDGIRKDKIRESYKKKNDRDKKLKKNNVITK
eukprot:GHVP01005594.1.p1 GENE.GHVP01005594.1~~GHVP01005594.1.p1  ORF type:complete len:830 (+),score=184.57 GHVP01005594.1:66-2555(+)